MIKMTKICVYAICKNESKFINRWLASMSEADYIVVLDTGSTDGTYEKLMSECPALFHRVTLGHIASFLGITQQSLSRIRAKGYFLT